MIHCPCYIPGLDHVLTMRWGLQQLVGWCSLGQVLMQVNVCWYVDVIADEV